jgi:hypothetical protein
MNCSNKNMLHTMRTKYISALAGALALGACTYDFPVQEAPTTGQADFTKMVAVGNSITAGFMDGALYTAGQNNSYPAIIARQAATLGGGVFNQPAVNSANGCFNPPSDPSVQASNGCTAGRLILRNPLSPAPSPTPGDGGVAFNDFTAVPKNQLNNWGVPGVTLATSLTPATGAPAIAGNPAFNRYYKRIASNPGVSTLIGDAAASLANGGSFFTFWLGNNDVLGYATGGASNPAILTSQTDFQTRFNAALNAMLNANANAEGAVANIPNVTSIPFFSTINPLSFVVPEASRPALGVGIDQLNAAINGWNAGVNATPGLTEAQRAALRRPTLSRNFTSYPLIILDLSLSDASVPTPVGPFVIPKIRNLVAGDGILICLTAASAPTALPAGMGISPASPLNETQFDAFYLTPTEQTEIQNAINGFNATIQAAVDAQSSRLVLVDTNKALADVRAGRVSINGSSFTASITPPFGAFSLDGVHPNQRGQGYIANLFIQAINAKWGAKIPLCNPNDFAGNALPIP